MTTFLTLIGAALYDRLGRSKRPDFACWQEILWPSAKRAVIFAGRKCDTFREMLLKSFRRGEGVGAIDHGALVPFDANI